MSQEEIKNETVSLLQDLGLKEYEARCFLALSQVSAGTAKEISELSEVPRTRVYDAVRVLEAQGLVEVQHSSPQQFRAVSVDEAAVTLRERYNDRIDTLRTYLEQIDLPEGSGDTTSVQEVWSLKGHKAIEARTIELLEEANSEVVLMIVDESILTDELLDKIRDAVGRDLDVLVGGLTDPVVSRIETELDGVETFQTGLEWLVAGDNGEVVASDGEVVAGDGEVAISRLMLVDRTRLLVSSFYPSENGEKPGEEQAVFATGLRNGFVVLMRRLISTGLAVQADPGK